MNENLYAGIDKKETTKNTTHINPLFAISKCTILALIVSLLITNFVFQAVTVDGNSMLPTLHSKDRLILEKISYYFHSPKADDVVVIIPPNNNSKKYIKRILAVGGDTIQIKDHKLYINGVEKNEKYIKEKMNSPYDDNFNVVQVIPNNYVCVLGDNRNHSQDSRDKSVSFIPLKNVLGKANIRIYPFNAAGLLK